MRRLLGILLNGVTIISALLFMTTLLLWGRSQWATDNVERVRDWREGQVLHTDARALISGRAGVWLIWMRTQRASPGPFWERQRQDAEEVGDRPRWKWLESPAAPAAAAPVPNPDVHPWGPLRLEFRDDRIISRTSRWRGVWVPYWVVAIPAAGVPVVIGLSRRLLCHRRRRRAERARRCESCGYDLRATPDRCPECGTVAAPATAQEARLPGPGAGT
jgi:hypothetical protein